MNDYDYDYNYGYGCGYGQQNGYYPFPNFTPCCLPIPPQQASPPFPNNIPPVEQTSPPFPDNALPPQQASSPFPNNAPPVEQASPPVPNNALPPQQAPQLSPNNTPPAQQASPNNALPVQQVPTQNQIQNIQSQGYSYPQYSQTIAGSAIIGYGSDYLPITQRMNEYAFQNELDIRSDYAKVQHRIDEAEEKARIKEDIRLKRENSMVKVVEHDQKLCIAYRDTKEKWRMSDPICDVVDLQVIEIVAFFRDIRYSAYGISWDNQNTELYLPADKMNANNLAKLLLKAGKPIRYNKYNKSFIYDLVYEYIMSKCKDRSKTIPFTTGWLNYSVDGNQSWHFICPGNTLTMREVLGI